MTRGMAHTPQPETSFSPGQRWRIILNVLASSLAALAVVILANYLGGEWYHRFHCSSRAGSELSPLTLKLVRSITNNVKVILFYDRDEPLRSTIAELLKEYHLANPLITVQSVDYNRDVGAGVKVLADYQQLLLRGQKDVVIFDCNGKQKVFPGSALTKVVLKQVPNAKERDERRKVTEFEGEKVFTSLLNAVTSPTRPKAYYLKGHGEHDLQSVDNPGYIDFQTVLRQNNTEVDAIELLGTNPIPADCRLLIIAGPQSRLGDAELDKIDQYLNEGGRLLALFKSYGINPQTGGVPPNGLETILAKWGVKVGDRVILDPEHGAGNGKGYDFVVSAFSLHPVVNPLIELGGLHLMPPRPVSRIKTPLQAPDALKVEEIAFTGDTAFAVGDTGHKQRFPVMAAVDATIKEVKSERGSTRLLIVGDSFFLDNQFIGWEPNRGFASYAANWLLDRPQLIDAIGPQPVAKYRIIMTKAQMQTTQLLLMLGMPGAVVFLGGIVWVRRRR